MADVLYKVASGVRLTASGSGSEDFEAMANNAEVSKVWIWDIGPEKPVNPKKPVAPKGRDGDPEYDLACVEFKEALKDYEEDRERYKKALKDHADFERKFGGPFEFSQWSCDARNTFDYDADAVKDGRQTRLRFYLSSRTRGNSQATNGGLPEGLKPGHGQADILRREREGMEDLIAARRADPVFGSEMRQ